MNTSPTTIHHTHTPLMENRVAGRGCHILRCNCPAIAELASPGQYLHIRVCEGNDPLLRRPISIMGADATEGSIEMLVVSVGRGTQMIVDKQAGETLDVVGPLGSGFDVSGTGARVLLIGGSFGVAPLIYFADTLKSAAGEIHITGLLGAKTADELFARQQFAASCDRVQFTTEDGSAGNKGLVTGAMASLLTDAAVDAVYTCGPEAMMAQVAKLCRPNDDIDCYVSMEQRMGCGIGACLSCVVPTNLEPKYQRVCADGPVFAAEDILWGELLE